MTIGNLVHITAARKLMIKISEETYASIYKRLYNECKKKGFPTERLAVYSRENDDGEEEHFAMVTPDKYDRQNMPKLEKLLRKDINFSSRMKPYDFINEDNEQVCGINLELISIRQVKQQNACVGKAMTFPVLPPKADEFVLRPVKSMTSKDVLSELAPKPKIKWNADLQKFDIPSSDSDSEIDEIADKAAARACSKQTELNAEEQAIDDDVEKAVAQLLSPPKQRNAVVVPAPPRRRRTPAATGITALEAE